jgi:beta-galactosidase
MKITIKYKNLHLLILFTGIVFNAMAQQHNRVKQSINEDWKFFRDTIEQAHSEDFNDSSWQTITLPHTWNKLDAIDEVKGYDRKVCWYRKTVYISKENAKKHSYLFFEGVNQIADVYVNGQYVGRHQGGYTQFNFEITSLIKYNQKNTIALKVDNRHNADIPPLSADFTFWGGIYRDVYLVHTYDLHFDNSHYASSGVYITTPDVSKEKATIKIRSSITNEAATKNKVNICYTINNNFGEPIFTTNKKIAIDKQASEQIVSDDIEIKAPNLWSPQNPYLYTVSTQIKDIETGEIWDEVIQPLGLRWFEFKAEEGFFINGEHLKLIGTNRHQDYLKMGNALPDEMHIRDVKLVKEMGGNFLRISHYPQDPTVLEMCDKLGILTSIEIPIVDKITESQAFTDNCIHMAKEMVYQNFNHPSVIIWAYMNEVLLRPPFKQDEQRHAVYVKNVTALAQQIEDTIRKADPSRYTMIPNHGAFDRYNDAKLTQIPMVVGWNLYQGWYGGEFPDFDNYLDKHRAELPTKPMIVTEYGADVHSRLHSFEPERFDYTVEYGNRYHEHYLKAIMERPFVAGATIWNLADFYSAGRGNARPTVNCKGIVGLDRELKDNYLLYKALLHQDPVVELAQKEWKIRGGIGAETSNQCTQAVYVYSNTNKVELFLNGQSMGVQAVKDYKAAWSVPFVNGENILEAVSMVDGKTYSDKNIIDFRMTPDNLKSKTLPFTEVNILLGSKRYFEDKLLDLVWIPEQAYHQGSWGYIGGSSYRSKTKYGSFPCADMDIKGTDTDPVFQSQRVGLTAFKMDVPDGRYTLSLLWAELVSDREHEKLAYNLGDEKIQEAVSQRVFNVKINGEIVEYQLNLTQQYGAEKAIIKKYELSVSGGKGITIEFEPISGNTILNALRLYKGL